MAHSGISTPAAILLGSFVVAAAGYLGLRDASISTRDRQVGTSGGPQQVSRGVTDEFRERVASQAAAVVDERRAGWIAACADGRSPGAYRVAMSFDAKGALRAWGLSEERGRSDPEVARCLRAQGLTASVAAPGGPVSVEIPLRLP
ncbi:MAG: hypothetical protein AAF721_38685 [Myxococcota bacterium]